MTQKMYKYVGALIFFLSAFFTLSFAAGNTYYICNGDIGDVNNWYTVEGCYSGNEAGTLPGSGDTGYVTGGSTYSSSYGTGVSSYGNVTINYNLVIYPGAQLVSEGTLYGTTNTHMTIENGGSVTANNQSSILTLPEYTTITVKNGGALYMPVNAVIHGTINYENTQTISGMEVSYGGAVNIRNGSNITLIGRLIAPENGGSISIQEGSVFTLGNNGSLESQANLYVYNSVTTGPLSTLVGNPVSFDVKSAVPANNSYNAIKFVGTTNVAYSQIGLPSGLELDPNTGIVTGTTTNAGTGVFFVTATTSTSSYNTWNTATQAIAYNIDTPPVPPVVVAPIVSSSVSSSADLIPTISYPNRGTIVLTFSEKLQSATLSLSNIMAYVGKDDKKKATYTVSGNKITITLPNANLSKGDKIRVIYTKSSNAPLKTSQGKSINDFSISGKY